MADEKTEKKTWSAKSLGSGTFAISKPKRKKTKLRQARVRNKRRAR